MWKALIAGLFVLAFAGAQAQAEMNPQLEAGIARFKSALRLKPEQQKHWPRVEAALRSMANEGDSERVQVADAQPGFIRRTVNRASELAMNATSMRRLVAAAQPLVKSLDQEQKREAITLARAMGFGQLAARFE
jgi:zinc resistance-associated protein